MPDQFSIVRSRADFKADRPYAKPQLPIISAAPKIFIPSKQNVSSFKRVRGLEISEMFKNFFKFSQSTKLGPLGEFFFNPKG
jgi:hypothetical protein